MLNEKERAHLNKNLNVKGPVGFMGGCLVLGGNAPHKGGEEEALVNICLRVGEVHVAIRSKHSVTLYTSYGQYEYLPLYMKQWVYLREEPRYSRKPEYVEMKVFSTEAQVEK